MKSIEEQTREAAKSHSEALARHIAAPYYPEDSFLDGVSWERSREKWIRTEDELPDPLQTVWISDGKGWTSLGCRTEPDADGLWCWAETSGTIYQQEGKIISECEADDLDVRFWQIVPEPPKQKDKI